MHVATHLRRGHSSTLGFELFFFFLEEVWRVVLFVFAGCGQAELGIAVMFSLLFSLVGEVTFGIFTWEGRVSWRVVSPKKLGFQEHTV